MNVVASLQLKSNQNISYTNSQQKIIAGFDYVPNDSSSSLHIQTKPDCVSNDPVKLIPSGKQVYVYRFGDQSIKMISSRETLACKHDESVPSGLKQCLTTPSVNLSRNTYVQVCWCYFKEKGKKVLVKLRRLACGKQARCWNLFLIHFQNDFKLWDFSKILLFKA